MMLSIGRSTVAIAYVAVLVRRGTSVHLLRETTYCVYLVDRAYEIYRGVRLLRHLVLLVLDDHVLSVY